MLRRQTHTCTCTSFRPCSHSLRVLVQHLLERPRRRLAFFAGDTAARDTACNHHVEVGALVLAVFSPAPQPREVSPAAPTPAARAAEAFCSLSRPLRRPSSLPPLARPSLGGGRPGSRQPARGGRAMQGGAERWAGSGGSQGSCLSWAVGRLGEGGGGRGGKGLASPAQKTKMDQPFWQADGILDPTRGQRDQEPRRGRAAEAARGVGVGAGGQPWQGGLEQVWACAVRARECVRVPVSVCVRARRCRWARCVAVPVCVCLCVCVGVCVMLLCMHLSVCVSCSSVCLCVGTLSAALLRCGVKEEQHVYSRACTPSAAVL